MLLLPLSAQAQARGLSIGASLPQGEIQVQQADGRSVTLKELMGAKGTAIVFWSNQCPWTDRYESRLQDLIREYQSSGIHFVLVNANDIEGSKKDVLESIQSHAERRGYRIPYVRDSGARLAELLGASRTPHVYLFDSGGSLIYSGAIDDSPSGPSQVEHAYLQEALEALGAGETPDTERTEAFGCKLQYP